MPYMRMEHAEDPAKELIAKVGDVSELDIFQNNLLLAVYIRPTKTKSGIILTEQYVDEDRTQSKVGLIIKKGPSAFVEGDDGKWFNGLDMQVGEWAVFRPSDGWQITVNNVLCRIIADTQIKGRVKHPDAVW